MSTTQQIFLWPGVGPGSEQLTLEEKIVERGANTPFRDRAVSNITRPTLTVHRPAQPNGLAILIAPGGGYERVVIDKEGVEIAAWLNALGITAFVLKYRLPGEGHLNSRDVPLQDAQRAMRLIRANALRFGISPSRVGAMGFSAGGHVISTLGTRFSAKVYEAVDAADENSARPDFLVLAYPVITMTKEFGHAGSRQALLGASPPDILCKAYSTEFLITSQTPSTLLVLPNDDASVPAENSIYFYLGLRRAGVSAEMHIYQQGGHGFGMRQQLQPVGGWTKLCEDWLRVNGWL